MNAAMRSEGREVPVNPQHPENWTPTLPCNIQAMLGQLRPRRPCKGSASTDMQLQMVRRVTGWALTMLLSSAATCAARLR